MKWKLLGTLIPEYLELRQIDKLILMKTKFLGQTINENLSWNKYINNVVC